MQQQNRFSFSATTTPSPEAEWSIRATTPIIGQGLGAATSLTIAPSTGAAEAATDADAIGAVWVLDGLTSNVRYATGAEVRALRARQEGLGRPHARRAALIPIKKSAAWWALAQDERRAIFEETSHHTQVGLDYLPQIARQLYHARDIGQPFDFLTWFEFAPADEPAFDELLVRLRATAEWTYVEREVEVRLERAS